MSSARATVGIASIGEMGAGIAKLLIAHRYRVLTNVSDRSESTRERARLASIELVQSDQQLLEQSDYILSIVPPRDALSTAQRFIAASKASETRVKQGLHYVDLNAISPSTATKISDSFTSTSIKFGDGGIIGGAPKLQPDGSWSKPSLVVSGPIQLDEDIAAILNVKHVGDTIGPGSGLKMCFASTTKGLTAIAIQSYTTAQKLGVLNQLQSHLEEYSPRTGQLAAKGLVDEMKEIASTFHDEGGFERDMFHGASEVYRFIADETDLGKEKTEDRKIGRTPEDVAKLVAEGMERKKVKVE